MSSIRLTGIEDGRRMSAGQSDGWAMRVPPYRLWDPAGCARARDIERAASTSRDMYDTFRLERYQVSWARRSLRIDLRML
jgi:hypothetical protein